MNCREFHQRCVELLGAAPADARDDSLAGHLADCPDCAQHFDEIMRTFESLRPSYKVNLTPHFKERVMEKITSIHVVAEAGEMAGRMKWVEFGPDGNPKGMIMKEAWAEFTSDGRLEALRAEYPDTEDGAKAVIWRDGKAMVWFKDEKTLTTIKEEKRLADYYPKTFFDPKQMVDDLYREQAEGKVTIETQKPSRPGEPIILAVTRTAKPPKQPDTREIYRVDPDTKLVLERKTERQQPDGAYVAVMRVKYLGYNDPIDPSVFEFNVPPDTMKLDMDMNAPTAGLAQDDLSDEAMAVKVAREFMEALAAHDYAKVGNIYGGFSKADAEKMLGELAGLPFRVISVGNATRHLRNWETRRWSYRVPCEFEVTTPDGHTERRTTSGLFMRPIDGQPGRWFVTGGL